MHIIINHSSPLKKAFLTLGMNFFQLYPKELNPKELSKEVNEVKRATELRYEYWQ